MAHLYRPALNSVCSQAIRLAPSSALLYANRAAAYLKRDWVSDSWAALQDCETAIRLDPMFVKAHCRRVHALNALGQLHVSLTQHASGCRTLLVAAACTRLSALHNRVLASAQTITSAAAPVPPLTLCSSNTPLDVMFMHSSGVSAVLSPSMLNEACRAVCSNITKKVCPWSSIPDLLSGPQTLICMQCCRRPTRPL